MRYRDQPSIEVTQRVHCDVATAWRYVTDITVPARCSAELQSVEWLDGAGHDPTHPAIADAMIRATGAFADRGRFDHANRVGNLQLAVLRQASSDNVLGYIARGIRSRAIDLCGVFP